MGDIAAVLARLEQASDLPDILDAAYDAFEAMLPLIWGQADRIGGGFAAFVMSAGPAANGRDAVAYAPSLPPPPSGTSPAAIPRSIPPGCGRAARRHHGRLAAPAHHSRPGRDHPGRPRHPRRQSHDHPPSAAASSPSPPGWYATPAS